MEHDIPDGLVLSGELLRRPDDADNAVARTPPAERRDPAVHQITTAAVPLSEDIRRRKRKYLISMALRTICFIMAIVVRHGPLLYFFIAGALFLPYAAVIIANAGREPNRTPPLMEVQGRHRALHATPEPGTDTDTTEAGADSRLFAPDEAQGSEDGGTSTTTETADDGAVRDLGEDPGTLSEDNGGPTATGSSETAASSANTTASSANTTGPSGASGPRPEPSRDARVREPAPTAGS